MENIREHGKNWRPWQNLEIMVKIEDRGEIWRTVAKIGEPWQKLENVTKIGEP